MKALTFLEFMQKIKECSLYNDCSHIIPDKAFTEEEIEYYKKKGLFEYDQTVKDNDFYDFNLVQVTDYWNQKPTIELIKELFKFKTHQMIGGDSFTVELGKFIHIDRPFKNVFNDDDSLFKRVYCINVAHHEHQLRVEMNNVLTLDLFITICKQCEIILEFKL